MTKFYFVTGDNCPGCNNVKKILSNLKLDGIPEVVEAGSEKGAELIKTYGIRGVPTLLKLRKGRKGEMVVEDALVGDRHAVDKFKRFFGVEV